MVIRWIRKYTGVIVSVVGFILLIILTFGDLGELFTEEYWRNVGGNITSIGALTVGLMFVQISIKQGVSEQALSNGLNTENTKNKYIEHKNIVKRCRPNHIYLPYFLGIRNKRETSRRRKEFLVDNGFLSEEALFASRKKKLIKAYKAIQTNITVDSIKWSTTEISYSKNGRIEKLDKYRQKRLVKAIVMGFAFMLGTTLITGGLFMDMNEIPVWQKLVKLATYLISISISVIFDIGKNYEKGAIGVPNELEEVNSIWEEFEKWDIPEWVIEEVKETDLSKVKEIKEIIKKEKGDEKILLGYEKETDTRAVIQEESEEVQNVQVVSTDSILVNDNSNNIIC